MQYIINRKRQHLRLVRNVIYIQWAFLNTPICSLISILLINTCSYRLFIILQMVFYSFIWKGDTLGIHIYIISTELESQREMYPTSIRGHGSWAHSYRIAGKCALAFPDIVCMNVLCLKGISYKIRKWFLLPLQYNLWRPYVYPNLIQKFQFIDFHICQEIFQLESKYEFYLYWER